MFHWKKSKKKETQKRRMKGTAEVIMGATLVMVVSLAVVLGLILVLLAELYCSLLLRRRQRRNTTSQTATATATTTSITNASSPSHAPPHSPPPTPPPPPSFTSIYSQGVLQAPRSFLFPPPFDSKHDMVEQMKQHHHHQQQQQQNTPSQLHQVIKIQTQESNANASPHCIGLVPVPSSLESFMSRAPPKTVQQDSLQGSCASETIDKDKPCNVGEHLVYISNPIYENDLQGKGSEANNNTPFETPDTSPSRLESGGDDDDEEVVVSRCGVQKLPCTPPLSPIKKLPAEASSVSLISLRDARSLGTSGSDSNNAPSSSSSASPCTSPSW